MKDIIDELHEYSPNTVEDLLERAAKEIYLLREDHRQLSHAWHNLMRNYYDRCERDMLIILEEQSKFSLETFGPGERTEGLIDHIKKELHEIELDPTDVMEWIDVAILAFDGAWRSGWEPSQIVEAYKQKLEKNKQRKWPDWRTAEPGKAIEHVRED